MIKEIYIHLLPGNNYFSQLDNLRSTHLEVGELYMEFKKCGDTKCVACCEIPGPVPESIPRPEPNVATQHYKPPINCIRKHLLQEEPLMTINPENNVKII